MHGKQVFYLLSFAEIPRKFIIAELSIRKLGSSSVLITKSKYIKRFHSSQKWSHAYIGDTAHAQHPSQYHRDFLS